MGQGRAQLRIAWLVVLASLAACQAEPTCLELTEIELSTLGLSEDLVEVDLGPDGLILLYDKSTNELVVSQLRTDTELVQLARIADPSNGLALFSALYGEVALITQDPGSGAIWVVQLDLEGPDRFYKFNAAGEALAGGTLAPPNETDFTRQITVYNGDLVRVVVRNPAASRLDWEASLERFSGAGELRWSRRIDYPEVADHAATFTGELATIDGLLAFTTYKTGIDSNTVHLLAVDPADGGLSWHRLLTNDDFSGSSFGISTDDDGRLLLFAKRSAPTRSIIEVLAVDGTTVSTHTTEWPDFGTVDVAGPVSSEGDLVQVAFGEGADYGPRPAVLAHLSGDGELLCRSPIEGFGEDVAVRLTESADDRVLLHVNNHNGPWQRLFAVEGL